MMVVIIGLVLVVYSTDTFMIILNSLHPHRKGECLCSFISRVPALFCFLITFHLFLSCNPSNLLELELYDVIIWKLETCRKIQTISNSRPGFLS